MISKNFTVNVFGMLSDNLYSGYINSDNLLGSNVYILTRKPVYDSFNGVVIAVAAIDENGTEKLIIAPEGEVFYEPEIRSILSNLKSTRIIKLSCLYEKSCGAVVFRRENKNSVRILLVKNHNGRHWSFPKGHIEYGEHEETTAIREIKEETDLDVEILKGFREETDYCPFGKIRKHVVFFLAESRSGDVRIQESEIDSYLWATPPQAHKLCTYENDHRLIDKAVKSIFLSSK